MTAAPEKAATQKKEEKNNDLKDFKDFKDPIAK